MPLFISNQKVQEMAGREADRVRGEWQSKVTELQEERRRDHQRIQEFMFKNILSMQTYQQGFVGNEYRNYSKAVKAISDKYNSKSDWGCLQTRIIIDLRAAFILGEGVKIVHKTKTRKEAEAELEWAKDFFAYNGLDAEMAQELAKEAEIEGKVALRLFWDDLTKEPFRKRKGMPSVRFLSWSQKAYTVKADPQDYLWYKELEWPASGVLEAGSVQEPEFVYKKFGGRLHDPNEAQPRVMTCLTQIDRLDKALRDLREINSLFAAQTPDFEVENAQQAAALFKWIADTNWKIGKAIVHIGKFELKGPDMSGVLNLDKEIETNTKLICGAVGVPPHFLGYVDLLSTRATGDNTKELVMAATTRERAIWGGVYEELLEKAMVMYNTKTGTSQKSEGQLDPEKIGVKIPLISNEHWAHIQNVLIPAHAAGIISKEFVASQIPDVDLEEEAERAQVAEENALTQAQEELKQMREQRFAERAGGTDKGAFGREDREG